MKTGTVVLDYPFTRDRVAALHAGDVVSVSGLVFTGRDRLHKHLAETGSSPVDLRDGALFHCGPVVRREAGGAWRIIAAGPTTSIREEPYQADLIERYQLRAVIGKGGMGPKTLDACAKVGCVYLHAVGGAAQVLAECVTDVLGVYLEEFGSPEAIWAFRVKDFPAVVTMDAHGSSLHAAVLEQSKERLKRFA